MTQFGTRPRHIPGKPKPEHPGKSWAEVAREEMARRENRELKTGAFTMAEKGDTLRARVMRKLRGGKSLTARTIAEGLGCHTDSVRHALGGLYKAGKVERVQVNSGHQKRAYAWQYEWRAK